MATISGRVRLHTASYQYSLGPKPEVDGIEPSDSGDCFESIVQESSVRNDNSCLSCSIIAAILSFACIIRVNWHEIRFETISVLDCVQI